MAKDPRTPRGYKDTGAERQVTDCRLPARCIVWMCGIFIPRIEVVVDEDTFAHRYFFQS